MKTLATSLGGLRRAVLAAAALSGAVLLAGCDNPIAEKPPMDSVQRGYRGTGMVQIINPRIANPHIEATLKDLPEAAPPVPSGGPSATTVFKNVQVLGDLNIGEFTRLMVAMTQWVSPDQGCAYCHAPEGMESDALYTKVVARRMLQMTRTINSKWKDHVAATGVTCYTCHRGNPVPSEVWFTQPAPKSATGFTAVTADQNLASPIVNQSSLPRDPFTTYLSGAVPINVVPNTALPQKPGPGIQQTEATYGLMMHLSQSLGVNCTYCHNSRSFTDWEQSSPQRITAWHGIRMVRELNNSYLDPLKPVYPVERLGVLGDAPKANCGTCHQGAFKPLYGAQMAKDYPELGGGGAVVPASAPAAAAPAPAAPAATGAAEAAPAQPVAPPAAGASTASAAAVASAAPAAAAAANAATRPGPVKVYFDTGRAEAPADTGKSLDAIVAFLKADPAAKVSISGYHDKTGDAAKNAELSKQRAFTVKGLLTSAGIAEDRIALQKPVETTGGASDREARRVEVTLAN